jgi:hypothetical protein
MVAGGSLLALIAALWILIKYKGFSALTTEGGFLYVTTFATVALSLGHIVPTNAKRFIAFIVLILGVVIFSSAVLGYHIFGLQVVSL